MQRYDIQTITYRSPDTGLYYNLKQYNLPYPEAIFDLVYFEQDPHPFLTLAKELYPGEKYHPNLGHHFVHLMHRKGKLLRMYTQNIDGLERCKLFFISSVMIVQFTDRV